MKSRQVLRPTLAFTGDLAFSGKEEEYTLARAWLDELWKVLPSGFPHDRLLIVPGNHDVDRALVTDAVQDSQDGLLRRNQQSHVANLLRVDGERRRMMNRHSAFFAFAENWFGNASTAPWWQRTIVVRGTRLHVAGLNSAWMAWQEKDRGNLLLSRFQINQTVQSAEADGADWRIALLHHPWDYFAEFDSREVLPIIRQRCDIVLRGHLHNPASERIVSPDPSRGCLELAAGCLYEDSQYPNAFQWIELYPAERRVRVRFRAWLHNAWTIDRNQLGASEGHANFSLESGSVSPSPNSPSKGEPPAPPRAPGKPRGEPGEPKPASKENSSRPEASAPDKAMAGDWRDIDGNKCVFERLSGVMASGRAIAFVGAGASAGLYPLWPQLIERLADETVNQGLASQADQTFWCNPKTKPQQAVQGIKKALGDGAYREALRQTFARRAGADGNCYTAVHGALMRLPFRGFVTTNYDLGLAEARGVLQPEASSAGYATWRDTDPVNRWLTEDIFRDQRCPILFAHGVCERTDTIVLGADEYRQAYATAPFSTLFDYLWGQCQLVFVGFGFSDHWLDFLADAAATRAAARDVAGPRHVAIIGLRPEEKYTPERRRAFRDAYNADPLFYPIAVAAEGKEDHSELSAILKALAAAVSPPDDPDGEARGKDSKQGHARDTSASDRKEQEHPPSPSGGGGGGEALCEAQEEEATEALRRSPAYFRALQNQRRFHEFRPGEPVPADESAMVHAIAQCTVDRADAAISFVRKTLSRLAGHLDEQSERRNAEKAAVSLYCLALAILVKDAILARLGPDELVIPVPTAANIMCAIIAMAKLRLKLEWVPGNREDLPEGKYIFDVEAPNISDRFDTDFILKTWISINAKDQESLTQSLDVGSDKAALFNLQEALTARLKYYLDEEEAVGIVVKGLYSYDGFEESLTHFAERYRIPVMVYDARAKQEFHKTTPGTLVAGIVEFWTRLRILPAQSERQHHTRTAKPTPESPPVT